MDAAESEIQNEQYLDAGAAPVDAGPQLMLDLATVTVVQMPKPRRKASKKPRDAPDAVD